MQAAPPAIPFGPARVVPPPGAFLQATREGEAAHGHARVASFADIALPD